MYEDFDYMNNAIEDAMADEQLDSIDIEYLIDQIEDQTNNLLSSGNKTNFLKSFEKQLDSTSVIKSETDVENIRESVYESILKSIAERFDIDIDMDNVNIRKAAKQFYKFFVLHYMDNLTYFIVQYIIDNRESIVDSLKHMDHINTKKISDVDSQISLILNNIADVVSIIANSNLNFDDFLEYVIKHPDSPSCAEEIAEYKNDMIDDDDDLFNELIKPLVDEEDGFGEVYINVQTKLYEQFFNEEEE